MGGANTIITNNTTNDKYKDYYPDNMSVVLNDNIPDDTFYILYNGKMDQPGFKCIYHIDNDNKLYLCVAMSTITVAIPVLKLVGSYMSVIL